MEAKAIPYRKAPWQMSRDYFYNNSTFHGTTVTRGKQLLRSQQPSLDFFGLGGDLNFTKKRVRSLFGSAAPGFFGKGFYVSKNIGGAEIYAQLRSAGYVLRCIIEPDSILDPNSVPEDILARYYVDSLRKGRAEKGLPPDEEKVVRYGDLVRKSNENFDQYTWISTLNKFATENGKKGVSYMGGGETVIFDPTAVECIVMADKTYEELTQNH
jgi:hypothetical protein